VLVVGVIFSVVVIATVMVAQVPSESLPDPVARVACGLAVSFCRTPQLFAAVDRGDIRGLRALLASGTVNVRARDEVGDVDGSTRVAGVRVGRACLSTVVLCCCLACRVGRRRCTLPPRSQTPPSSSCCWKAVPASTLWIRCAAAPLSCAHRICEKTDDSCDTQGHSTALLLATGFGYEDNVAALLRHNADPSIHRDVRRCSVRVARFVRLRLADAYL
jgi:hypothetical protein